MAIQNMNHACGCRVMPDDSVNAVRPPGMKRAVMSSSASALGDLLFAQSRRLPNCRLALGTSLEPASRAPTDEIGGVVAEERAERAAQDHRPQRVLAARARRRRR